MLVGHEMGWSMKQSLSGGLGSSLVEGELSGERCMEDGFVEWLVSPMEQCWRGTVFGTVEMNLVDHTAVRARWTGVGMDLESVMATGE